MQQSQSEPSMLPKGEAARFDGYVQRNLWIALGGVFAFALCMAGIAMVFEPQLVAVTQWIANAVGVGGLLGIVFVGDALLSPIAPEFVLLVVAHSSLAAHGLLLACLMGGVSWLAGCVGWALGVRLQATRLPLLLFGRRHGHHRALFARYGRWAVGLGALTPIPYSLTCWSAGMLNVSLRDVILLGALRVPRIVLAYLFIAYADDMLSLLF